jgi:spore germination protein
MTIHTVQKGDTIYSIAQQYNIPYTRLIKDNDLSLTVILNIGENLIINYPEKTYIVKNGDTLESVAATFGVPVLQLLRNNPELSDSGELIPGDEIIISYNNRKKIKVNGFANSFINMELLKKSLPFLTYITILNYRVNEEGNIVDIEDTMVVKTAKEYGVAPLMFISTLNEYGVGGYGIVHALLNNPDLQNKLIESTLNTLKAKGYFGLYLGFQHVLKEDLNLYVDFIKNVTNSCNREGYEVFISLIPSTFGFASGVPYTEPYFQQIGQIVNYVTLVTYQWTTSTTSEFYETTPAFLNEYLSYVVTQIPPEKIFLGFTRIAYDWELPYVAGVTQGRFLTNSGAVNLASQVDAVILFDNTSQTPYYNYNSLAGVQHLVWFKDAKSYDIMINLVTQYGLAGIAIWNLMYYYSPFNILINSQLDIETLP